MDILEEIAARGWDEYRAQEFERRYGEAIRWRIVIYMEKMRLIQRRLNPERVDLLSDRRLELFQDTHSDLWLELLDGLVHRYVEGKRKGKIRRDFLSYISGTIRHLLVKNARELKLLGEETPYELLSGICETKRERKAKLAWAKYCLWHQVELEILNRSADDDDCFQVVYRNIHHVVDYFFEVFVPKNFGLLKRSKRHPVAALVEAMLEEEIEEALNYIGKVTPFAAAATEVEHQEEDEDAFLSSLAQGV